MESSLFCIMVGLNIGLLILFAFIMKKYNEPKYTYNYNFDYCQEYNDEIDEIDEDEEDDGDYKKKL